MSFLQTLFGQRPQRVPVAITTALDLVTYTAKLASNPDKIDPMLDAVRVITADLQPGQAPSDEDEQALLGIYLELEGYLTTKEPLRSFTKEGLRARIQPELRTSLEAYEANH